MLSSGNKCNVIFYVNLKESESFEWKSTKEEGWWYSEKVNVLDRSQTSRSIHRYFFYLKVKWKSVTSTSIRQVTMCISNKKKSLQCVNRTLVQYTLYRSVGKDSFVARHVKKLGTFNRKLQSIKFETKSPTFLLIHYISMYVTDNGVCFKSSSVIFYDICTHR